MLFTPPLSIHVEILVLFYFFYTIVKTITYFPGYRMKSMNICQTNVWLQWQLTRSSPPYNTNLLPGSDVARDPLQDKGQLGAVSHLDLLELQVAAGRPALPRRGG